MRIGYAAPRFSLAIRIGSLSIIAILAIWAYAAMPDTRWRLANFVSVCCLVVIAYANIGVWLHEHLHCLAYRGTGPKERTHIEFRRRYVLFLNGHYRVSGPIDYRTKRRALLAPSLFAVAAIAVGFAGAPFLPAWWLPILLAVAVAGMLDMTHDLYMYSQIRAIGGRGRYWDMGKYIEAVWRA
jgi:hypothetical protein